jgi:hypothetical protein
MRVLVHGEERHPVGRIGTRRVPHGRVAHGIREGTAPGDDGEPSRPRRQGQRAHQPGYVAGEQASSQLHDGV